MADSASTTGYAPVNGLELYYEIHGDGQPTLLLHGAYGFTGMWGDLLPGLAAGRQVIAVALQGHGRTAVLGDADAVRPEHGIEMLRALGGGIVGKYMDGSPRAQLAILPNTAHIGVAMRTELLLAMIPTFLDAPEPAPESGTITSTEPRP